MKITKLVKRNFDLPEIDWGIAAPVAILTIIWTIIYIVSGM